MNDSSPQSHESTTSPEIDFDAISLRQALQDFDVANARVMDLTRRLTTMNTELQRVTTQLQKAQLRNRKFEAELRAIKGSRAYRGAAAAGRAARVVRSRVGK